MRMMQLSFPVPFICPESIEPYLQKVFSGEYDVPVSPDRPKILDLGANCGAFSVWAVHRFPGCEIEAYEPHPKTFEFLVKNTGRFSQIKCHNVGVGMPGLRVLHNGVHNCGEMSFHRAMDNPAPTGQHIEVIDPLSLPEADILKMDIEGCEMEVLGPLIKAGRKFDLILLEWHNHKLRREIDSILIDYEPIAGRVESLAGRGVLSYLRKDLF